MFVFDYSQISFLQNSKSKKCVLSTFQQMQTHENANKNTR